MAMTEHNIIMNEITIKEDGSKDTKTLYPTTKAEICLCGDGKTVEEKFDEMKSKAFSILTSAWTLENGLYVAIISDSSIAENDFSDIAVDSTSYNIAVEAGMKSYTTEITGGIKVYADKIPTGTISGKYSVNRGVLNG